MFSHEKLTKKTPQKTAINPCPNCGAPLRVRSSRPLGKLRESRRECSCGYADVALIQPEKILQIHLVNTKLGRPKLIAKTLTSNQENSHEQKTQRPAHDS